MTMTMAKTSFLRCPGLVQRFLKEPKLASRPANYLDLIAIRSGDLYARAVSRTATDREPRVTTRCQVELDGPLGRIVADSEDLSTTGLFVRTDELLRVGTVVVLRVTLPNRTIAQVRARVAHLIKPSVASAL